MLLSKYAMCDSEKSRFIKKQEVSGLLGNLEIRTTLSKIPLLCDILFWKYGMNKIVKELLIAGDKFMPETHLRKPDFTYTICGLSSKNKERVKGFKEARDSRCIYQNELDKACFQHNLVILKIYLEESFW